MLLLAFSFLNHFYYTIWDIVILGVFSQIAILAEKWSKKDILLTYLLQTYLRDRGHYVESLDKKKIMK